ncbi:MAG: hypothetical protein ACRD29_15285 [Acidimicrobiales bacterium]
MTPIRRPDHEYDPELVERVRRTLRAVAEATEVDEVERDAPPTLGPRRLGTHPRAGAPPLSSRGRLALGTGVVGAAAAVLLAFVALSNRVGGPPGPTDAADGRGAHEAAPAVLDSGAETATADADVLAAAVPTDVAVPGWVPAAYEYKSFDVLDGLSGSVEANVYTQGDEVLAAFVTDEPDAAQRLAERTELWGSDGPSVRPTTRRGDGYLTFTRAIASTARAESVMEELVANLAEGAAPVDAAWGDYELAASIRTVELPEAGRLVRVAYEESTAAGELTVETRQGTLSPELAAVLYPNAAPLAVRGRPGFSADATAGGSLLIWQEAPGLVVSVTADDVDGPTLDSFVSQLAVVTEETWVTLRESAGGEGEAPEPLPDLPPRVLTGGELAGRSFTLEALDGGSLDHGVVGCHRLSVDGAPFDEAVCGAVDRLASKRQADTVIVWAVVPAQVVSVQANAPVVSGPVIGVDPFHPTGSRQVLLVFTARPADASIDFRDAAGNLVITQTAILG